MPGTLVTFGTRHAWNAFRWGLDMPGTFENVQIRFLRTSYTLGPIWLAQIMRHKKWIFWSNRIGPKMYEVRRIRFLKFLNVPGMPSPHRKAFQACLVPNVTNVPGIRGPQFYHCSTHTWSLMSSSFQACLVPFIFNVPGIPGPHYDQCSLHS